MTELLTVRAIALMCRLHEMTVRRHIREGRLKAVRVGKGIRVRSGALESYLALVTESGSDADEYIHVEPLREDDPLFALVGLVHAPEAAKLSENKYAAFPEAYSHES